MTARPPAKHSPDYNPDCWVQRNGRRHLARTDGFDWFTARTPDPGPYAPVPPVLPPGETDDVETTGSFSLDALRADWDPPSAPLRLWEDSGPLPIIPERRDDDPPSMRWAWLAGFYLLLAFAASLLTISLGGG